MTPPPTSAPRAALAASVILLLVVVVVVAIPGAAGFPGRAGPAGRGRRGAADVWCAAPGARWEPALRRIAAEGRAAWGDSGAPENTPPPWFDARRYAAGKAFASKHPVSIAYAHIHALFLLFAVPSVLDVLVYTRNSETPDKAFARYVDTINGVGSWYWTDMYRPGSVGYEQLKRVRMLHNLVRRDMSGQRDQGAVRNRTRVDGDFSGCRVSAALRRDLGAVVDRACPFARGRRAAPDRPDADDNNLDSDEARGAADGGDAGKAAAQWMSQYDMAMTQWAFVGPVIQFPEAYGIGNATTEELDGFVHLWEVIGYSLGIEDRFNFCQGGLAATLRRSAEALAGLVLPGVREARPPWEYMARCMADGLGYVLPGVNFKVQLASMLRLVLAAPSAGVEAMLTPLQRQSAEGFRGLLAALRRDGADLYRAPLALAFTQIYPMLRTLPKDEVKRLRHQPPYRGKGCAPTLRP